MIFVRMVTLVFGLLMTRVLSGHFSLKEYGTYSQVMLLTTTISSMTILGMMDGINFFFCREKDEQKRNAYISTIFFLQYLISTIVSITILACTVPISKYFDNESLKSLMIFAAVLPILQNSISLLQIMFIAIGKAKMIAIRNLLVSVVKLLAIVLACYVFDNIAVLLLSQVLMDIIQVIYFFVVLKHKNCKINILRFDKTLIKEILIYCIPMAMFAVIKSLNRDSDKFVISFFTDTETLAVYTNASKLLPFDIVMTSFCTVLLPYITRYIANKKYEMTQVLYKSFLELSYIATTILAIGAVAVAPELMRFLYTEKYASYDFGVYVFIIYILVDVLSVLNITIILSAAGKTKTILFASIGTFFANIFLNIGSFFVFEEVGPALTTLLVTLVQGIVILSLGAREIKTNILKLFDKKYLLFFIFQIICCFLLVSLLRSFAVQKGLPYLVILFGGYGIFAGALFLCNGKRLLKNLRTINKSKVEE
ncbi:MAG: hypothetical protein E7387_03635 [Ruminococcaceae bacterium]|nr:hypothetical protein [Oscillospiraceae bacterium]